MRLGVNHFNLEKPNLEEFYCTIYKEEIQSNLGAEEESLKDWVLIPNIMT